MKASTTAPAEPLLNIVVFSADVDRVMATRRAARNWPLRVHVEWAGSAHETVRRARELPAHLVLIDAEDQLDARAATARHLQRHRPAAATLTFADTQGAGGDAAGVWGWQCLAQVLDAWLELHLKSQALLA